MSKPTIHNIQNIFNYLNNLEGGVKQQLLTHTKVAAFPQNIETFAQLLTDDAQFDATFIQNIIEPLINQLRDDLFQEDRSAKRSKVSALDVIDLTNLLLDKVSKK